MPASPRRSYYIPTTYYLLPTTYYLLRLGDAGLTQAERTLLTLALTLTFTLTIN